MKLSEAEFTVTKNNIQKHAVRAAVECGFLTSIFATSSCAAFLKKIESDKVTEAELNSYMATVTPVVDRLLEVLKGQPYEKAVIALSVLSTTFFKDLASRLGNTKLDPLMSEAFKG